MVIFNLVMYLRFVVHLYVTGIQENVLNGFVIVTSS